MSLQWPKTIRGWVELVVAVGVLLSAVAGAGWKYHTNNAYASDVHDVRMEVMERVDEVEQYAAQGIKTATCNQLRFTIAQLRREKANNPDAWTGTDEAYLQDLLLQWQQNCRNKEG